MLARLIHLDLRFAYKRFLAMAAVLLLLGLLAPYMSDEGLLGLGLTVVFTATMTAVPAFCVALVVQHFRRNLFSNEGYLMFTLPVSATKLLLSKVITTLIWFNLMLAAALGLFALLNREQIPAGFLEALSNILSWGLVKTGLRLLLGINLTLLPVVLGIFMGITLSQTSVRNEKLGNAVGIAAAALGIGSYAWTSARLSGWTFFETFAATHDAMGRFGLSVEVAEPLGWVIALAFSALFFVITTHAMRHKLNLE